MESESKVKTAAPPAHGNHQDLRKEILHFLPMKANKPKCILPISQWKAVT